MLSTVHWIRFDLLPAVESRPTAKQGFPDMVRCQLYIRIFPTDALCSYTWENCYFDCWYVYAACSPIIASTCSGQLMKGKAEARIEEILRYVLNNSPATVAVTDIPVNEYIRRQLASACHRTESGYILRSLRTSRLGTSLLLFP